MDSAQISRATGGPAFPVEIVNTTDRNVSMNGEVVPPGMSAQYQGITIRDYFAAKALLALFTIEANPRVGVEQEPYSTTHRDSVASEAYALADAMLAARAKP